MSNFNIDNIEDLTGRIIIVTGANSGIGYETCINLLKKNATLIMGCRSQSRGNEALNKLKSQFPGGNIDLILLTLDDFSKIEAFVKEFGDKYDHLDNLINNAGTLEIFTRYETAQGFESTFATNVLGPFYLTLLLMPLLKKSNRAVITNISSMMHQICFGLHWQDLHYKHCFYNGLAAYSQSKLANLLFTHELNNRLKKANVHHVIATSAHPGSSATNIAAIFGSGFNQYLLPWFSQPASQGCLPTILASVGPDLKRDLYFGPINYFQIMGAPGILEEAPQAHNRYEQAKLWSVCEESIGQNFEI